MAHNAAFFTMGRFALLFLVQELRIDPGDCILCPAFTCASSLEPLEAAGYAIKFIDVNRDLSISVESLVAKIDEHHCRAVILPVYFGLFDSSSPAIYEECKLRGVKLIKDYAHSYLSYISVEDHLYCDAVVLSLRKSVNIPYGGAAILKAPPRAGEWKKTSVVSNCIYFAAKWLERLAVLSGINIYGKTITRLKRTLGEHKPPERKIVPVDIKKERIQGYTTRYLLNAGSPSTKIAELRRNNFHKLSKTKFVFAPALYQVALNGKVPQVYPVLGNEDLYQYLREKGIGATKWPFTDAPRQVLDELSKFPGTAWLMDNIICLPLHQHISNKHIEKMVREMEAYSGNFGNRTHEDI